MDSFEFNKIAGAVLGTLMLTMALGLFSGFVFSPPVVTKPGYALPNAAAEAAPAEATATTAQPLPVLLAKADVAKGMADTKVCQSCHNFEKGAGAKIGPPLYGVVGRPVASIAGFDYSDALKKKGGNWTLDDINNFITNPKVYAPGTKMGFAGEENPEKRADIVDYLHTLSDSPQPLPTAAAQPTAQPASAPGGQQPAPQPATHAAPQPASPQPAAPAQAAPEAPAKP